MSVLALLAHRGVGRPLAAALLLVVAAFLAAPVAIAQVDTSTREQIEQDIDRYEALLDARRNEIAAIEDVLGDTQSTLETRIVERDRIAADLQRVQQQREVLLAEIASLERQRADTEQQIVAKERELEVMRAQIQQLLVNLYRQRSSRFARAVSQAESFHDLQVKNHYLSLLADQDVQIVEELDGVLAELVDLQQTLSQQIAEQSRVESELAQAEVDLDTARASLQAVINDLDATRQGQLAQRRALLEAQGALERTLGDLEGRLAAEVRRLEQEEARLRDRAQAETFLEQRQELLRQADQARARIDNLTTPVEASGSGFIRPVDGTVESRFGDNGYSFVAFRASAANSAVRSVQSGVVVQVQSLGANDGFMVAVTHGSDRVTAYTNLRPPVVQVGDRVEQGQVLGYLGGGTLIPSDILRLYLRVASGAYVDPVAQLGL